MCVRILEISVSSEWKSIDYDMQNFSQKRVIAFMEP